MDRSTGRTSVILNTLPSPYFKGFYERMWVLIIYVITNKITGKKYVGQTTKDTYDDRWNEHRYPCKACKSLIGKAVRKYGKENFSIEVIDNAITTDELNKKEIYWIKELNTVSPKGYNISYGGMNSMSNPKTRKQVSESLKGKYVGWHHTEETKKKMSENQRGEKSWNLGRKMHPNTKKALDEFLRSENNPNKKNKKFGKSNPFYGKHHSEETKQKLRDKKLGKPMAHKGRPFSEEHKQKLKDARKKYLESKKNFIPKQLELFNDE